LSEHIRPAVPIVSTLPKAWEHEESFNDVLYQWMSRAPWLLISGALHFVIFLVVAAIPWNLITSQPEQTVHSGIEPPPSEEFVDPPEVLPEELEPVETEEVPIVEDYQLAEQDETDTDDVFELSEGDPAFRADSPFDATDSNAVLGIGGAAGGKYGGRLGGGRNTRPGDGQREQALKDGLEWLKRHQDEDGKWDCAGFMKHDPASDLCTGAGDSNHDVGVTGLALLAFLGDGHTLRHGQYKDVVSNGLRWLRDQQDPESGLIGEEIGHAFLYDHGIATLAVCEAYYFDRSPLLRSTAQRAVSTIGRARNPYGAWRYALPGDGDNDTSVTGWMVFALKSAQEGGLKVDNEAFVAARNWFDEVTDPNTGRCGYDSIGSPSSRVEGHNEAYPAEKGEAMTAVALLCRVFMGDDPSEHPVMERHAELLRKSLPVWDPSAKANDMYYWYYGTYAMYQMGGEHWQAWNKAMKPAVLESQRMDGASKGSWDPLGPWGWSGGRVYSTALMVLCLEVYFRYGKVLGAR
jgi:hypothetical protein